MTKHAKTYAGALFDLAKEEGLEDVILKDTELISGMLRDIEGYSGLLQSPVLSNEERNELLDEAWKETVHPYTLNFLKMLCDQGKAGEFPECASEYKRSYNEANGISTAVLTCASELPGEMLERLSKALEKRLGKKIELLVETDKDLIGGLRLDVDGMRFDGSIAGHLDELRKLLNA